jgi:hypothetical protein
VIDGRVCVVQLMTQVLKFVAHAASPIPVNRSG